VKIPEHKVVVTLDGPEVTVLIGFDLDEDLAVQQQGEELISRKAVLATQLPDLLGCRHCRDGGRNLWIADLEQRAGARRFQHKLCTAPSHIGEPRQENNIGITKRRCHRPIIRNLWFDDDRVVAARVLQAVLKQAMPRQSLHKTKHLLVDLASAGGKRGERQTRPQTLRALRRRGAERSQADRIAVEARQDVSTPVRFERDMTEEPGGHTSRFSAPGPLCFEIGSAQYGMSLKYAGEAD
jgi:hypothetical protein